MSSFKLELGNRKSSWDACLTVIAVRAIQVGTAAPETHVCEFVIKRLVNITVRVGK